MNLTVLGINHKTASVSFRERVAFNPSNIKSAYLSAKSQGFSSMLILSTCNRTEIYCHQTDIQTLILWFANFVSLSTTDIEKHAYIYQNDDVLQHLIRVASGLDSMILGEPQILGQLKQAYAVSQENHMVNKKFAWIMEQVFSATKKVRFESKLGEQAVSLAYAVAKLTEQIFDNIKQKTLLLVAVGEMNQLVARHISKIGIGQIILANRNQEKAQKFAQTLHEEYGITTRVIPFIEVENNLHTADIICSCTASLDIIIPFQWIKNASKKRRYVPMLVVDLAVPRDIDPKVTKLDDVYHYTVDDLQHVLAENIEKRRSASVYAEVIVSQQVTTITTNQRLKDLSHFMKQYQYAVELMASDIQNKAQQQLIKGEDPLKITQQLTKQLTAKLMHTQFQLLKQAASLEDRQTLDFMVSELSKNTLPDT